MQGVDHLVGTAGNRHDHFQIQAFAPEETLTLGDHDGQRIDASQCRIGCTVTQGYGLGGDGCCDKEKESDRGKASHQRPACSVQSISIGDFSPGAVRRM